VIAESRQESCLTEFRDHEIRVAAPGIDPFMPHWARWCLSYCLDSRVVPPEVTVTGENIVISISDDHLLPPMAGEAL
jgi:hypothetical protein